MQRIIIVEGPDMTGKTQIAKELSKRLNVPYFKARNEHTTFMKEKQEFVNHLLYADPRVADFIGQTGQSIVFDRAYPSEFVYSKVLNRTTDARALEFIDEQYAQMNAWIIICHRSSYEGIVDDIDPTTLSSAVLRKIDDEYQAFMKWTRCKNKMLLNVDDEDLDRELDDVLFGMGCASYRKK